MQVDLDTYQAMYDLQRLPLLSGNKLMVLPESFNQTADLERIVTKAEALCGFPSEFLTQIPVARRELGILRGQLVGSVAVAQRKVEIKERNPADKNDGFNLLKFLTDFTKHLDDVEKKLTTMPEKRFALLPHQERVYVGSHTHYSVRPTGQTEWGHSIGSGAPGWQAVNEYVEESIPDYANKSKTPKETQDGYIQRIQELKAECSAAIEPAKTIENASFISR